MMSNTEINIAGESREEFDLALQLIFLQHKQATHWKVENNKLYLSWFEDKGSTIFPFPLEIKEAKSFCWKWLKKNPSKEREPRIDGHAENCGFKIEYLDGGWSSYFVSIEPIWALFHK